MKTLNEHLKTKTFKNVYLLYGDEAYLRNQYRDKLKKAMINEGDTMNYSCFEGKGIDEKELTAMADTVPFFSDYRLIIVENSGFFKTSGHETLAEYMKHIPETTCIVFVESEVDKRSKLFKAVSSTGYAANLTMPGDKQLMLWLGGIVKRENKLIQEQTMQYFLQLVEHDMNGMRQEMEKLICYVGHRQVIEKADVDAVCCVFVENKVFDMISAVANASFLIFQILIGAFVIWRLLILLGGSGTYRGVMCNYIYGLAYTNALRTVVIVFVHILGLILFAISQQKYVADIAYLVTMFSQYYAVFICAQLMRRYLGLGIVKTYIVMFIVALLSVSVLPQWIRIFHTLVK